MIGPQVLYQDWSALRDRVHAQLNQLGDFVPGAFQITERLVCVGGNPCGVHYCLHGPRNVKLTAVVDLKKQSVLYYGTDGQRIEQQSLGANLHGTSNVGGTTPAVR